MIDQAVRQTTAAAYPPVWHYGYPGIYESAYTAAPCEGCRKKFPFATYRYRVRCASCAKDVLAGLRTINRPEYPEDYDPEPRWRDVSPEAHRARRASYELFFAKPGGCGFTNKLPTHRGSGRGLNPAGLCFVMVCPGAFRSWSGGWLRTVGSGMTTAAIGVTNRLNQFLTDRRSRCASSCATTPNRDRTPGTRL